MKTVQQVLAEKIQTFENVAQDLENRNQMTSAWMQRSVARALRDVLAETYTSRTRKIITLCGSTKFGDAYRKANLELTLKGYMVFTVGSMTQSDADLVLTDEQKLALDELHKDKIAMSDEIFVLNVEACRKCRRLKSEPMEVNSVGAQFHFCERVAGQAHEFEPYIGESTASEIAHALKLKKYVSFLNDQPMTEFLLKYIGKFPAYDLGPFKVTP